MRNYGDASERLMTYIGMDELNKMFIAYPIEATLTRTLRKISKKEKNINGLAKMSFKDRKLMDLEEFELESFRRYGDIGNEKQYVIYKGLCASKGVVFVRTPPIDLINNWLVAN